ncbi:MAG: hypothetical protein WCI38_02910 [Chthoniobacterales bacterium]
MNHSLYSEAKPPDRAADKQSGAIDKFEENILHQASSFRALQVEIGAEDLRILAHGAQGGLVSDATARAVTVSLSGGMRRSFASLSARHLMSDASKPSVRWPIGRPLKEDTGKVKFCALSHGLLTENGFGLPR